MTLLCTGKIFYFLVHVVLYALDTLPAATVQHTKRSPRHTKVSKKKNTVQTVKRLNINKNDRFMYNRLNLMKTQTIYVYSIYKWGLYKRAKGCVCYINTYTCTQYIKQCFRTQKYQTNIYTCYTKRCATSQRETDR